MITMGSAVAFLIACIVSCAFFTLGRFIEKIEKKSKDRDRRVEDLLSGSGFDNSEYHKEVFETSFSDDLVIDAEYEDVVLDLQKYRKRKAGDKRKEVDATLDYEIMYYKKNNEYIKLPSEIADLIRYLKKNM